MKPTRRRKLSVFAVTIAALVAGGALTGEGPLLLGNGEAHAIVGRPLTPISYAGVARRTTRRSVYAASAVAASTAPTTVVVSLPPGCTHGAGTTYQCGSTAYQPEYDGPTVVYAPVH